MAAYGFCYLLLLLGKVLYYLFGTSSSDLVYVCVWMRWTQRWRDKKNNLLSVMEEKQNQAEEQCMSVCMWEWECVFIPQQKLLTAMWLPTAAGEAAQPLLWPPVRQGTNERLVGMSTQNVCVCSIWSRSLYLSSYCSELIWIRASAKIWDLQGIQRIMLVDSKVIGGSISVTGLWG